jgi:hypothetical protein
MTGFSCCDGCSLRAQLQPRGCTGLSAVGVYRGRAAFPFDPHLVGLLEPAHEIFCGQTQLWEEFSQHPTKGLLRLVFARVGERYHHNIFIDEPVQ